MTAITPLESIHKKGTFGDHHKQNESDLLKISEVKDLTVVQIFQYKKSQIKLEEIEIDGVKFPEQNSSVSCNEVTRILWSAPRTWLVTSKKENIIKIIEKNCNIKDFAITDISHSRAIIQIEGANVKEVLNAFTSEGALQYIFHSFLFISLHRE